MEDTEDKALEWRDSDDVLSAVVDIVGLRGLLLSTVSLGSPWRVRNPTPASPVLHVVNSGQAYISTPATPTPIELNAGDVVMLPKGGTYEIVDQYPSTAETLSEVPLQSGGTRCSVRLGGTGHTTELTCCMYRFESPAAAPLLNLLPPVIAVCRPEQSADIRFFLSALVGESTANRPGTEGTVSRLAELVLLRMLRAHFETQDSVTPGLLAATADPHIGAALGLIHASLSEPWTVATLASKVGMSRAAFSQLFSEKAGVAPIRYIQMCRIQRATRLLVESPHSLSEIGRRIGYSDATAFSRAFRREVGVSPREYRARRGQTETTP